MSMSVNAHDFVGKHVLVETCEGSVMGVLVGICRSWHNGFGTLILRVRSGYVIVRKWRLIRIV